jgi:hypothetical protein
MSKNTMDNSKNIQDIEMSCENKQDDPMQPETPWINIENSAVNFDNKISEEIIKWGSNKDLIRRQMLRKEKVLKRVI